MAYHLRIINGREAGQRFTIDRERMVVGRGKDVDITLDAVGASREHCELRLDDGRLSVQDLGSRNGTKVGGSAISGSVTLRFGDKITIGTMDMLVGDDRHQGAVRLTVIEGADLGHEFPIEGDRCSIGRGAQADARLADKGASRINSIIERKGAGWTLSDDGSANGTRLNGERISGTVPLRSGDTVQVGATLLEFVDGRIEDLAGTVLAGATLVRRVGTGSLGVVYLGKSLQGGDEVAVKVIDPAITSDAAEKGRLLNAARAGQRLEHLNLAPVHAVEPTDGGGLAIRSAWAENGSLDDLLATGDPPPPMVVATLILDAARGLAHAATEGVFHQGLRPGNILIFRDGVGRVADLGSTLRYQVGQQAGGVYPYYVSPEELAGKPVDATANQFSLGAVAYHALTGQPPFAEETAADSASARLTGGLPAISEFNQAVPTPLALVVSRMLGLEPGERYPNWDAVIADLETVIAKGAHAKIATPAHSLVASASAAAVPRRAAPIQRGRGARPRTAATTDSADQGLSMNLVVGLIAAGLVLMLLIGVAVSGGGSTPVPSSSGTAWQHEIPDPVVATTSDPRPAPRPVSTPATGPRNGTSEEGNDAPPRGPNTRLPGYLQNLQEDGDTATGSPAAPPAARPEPTAQPQPEPASPAPAPPPEPEPAAPAPHPQPTAPQPQPEPTPAVALVDGLPVRDGSLLDHSRPGTWEEGALILTDGSRRGIAFKRDGERFLIRDQSGAETAVRAANVAELAFVRPNDVKLRMGDQYLAKREFDKALEKYEEAAEDYPDHPYRLTARDQALALKARFDEAMSRIVNGQADGDARSVIDGLLTYIEIMQPRRLDRPYADAWESMWPRIAGKVDSATREAWMAIADEVGVRLEYDERAPELLAAAMDLARAPEPDHRAIVDAFEEAVEAVAWLDDEAKFRYALSLHEEGNDAKAMEWLSRTDHAFRSRTEVENLAMALGIKPPRLEPELLVSTYIGGPGNQAIESVGFENGVIVGRGNGFQVIYNPATLSGSVSGTIPDDRGDAKYDTQPHHPKSTQTLEDPRNGQTYSITTKQVHGILQQPYMSSSAGWKMWSWSYADVNPGTNGIRWGPLMADSRGYDVWLMPDGLIGVKCWTDGGNSVLTRHPLDLKEKNPIEDMGVYKRDSGGMATLFMLVDPNGSQPVVKGGTFVSNHVTKQVVDQWGRVYIPVGVRTENLPFGGSGGRGGLFVLGPDLSHPEVNLRFGGSGDERMGRIALAGNLLILGGYTDSKDLLLKNAVQEKPGGGQDAWLAVIRLWKD